MTPSSRHRWNTLGVCVGATLLLACGGDSPGSPNGGGLDGDTEPPSDTAPTDTIELDTAAADSRVTGPDADDTEDAEPADTLPPVDTSEGVAPGDPDALALPSGGGGAVWHFVNGATCATCHSNEASATAMRDAHGRPIGQFDLWRSSVMANASRDPIWRAYVAAEMARTPSAAEAIAAKCMTCHAPMQVKGAEAEGAPAPQLADLAGDDSLSALGRDGVSCTMCHQLKPDNLGQEESFSGGFEMEEDKVANGPHDDQFTMPMLTFTGHLPRQGLHMLESRTCSSCHTLETAALTEDGEPAGPIFPEQTPYLEWRNSAYSTEVDAPGPQAASCQDCHMPKVDEDGEPISTRIARRPGGGDYPPIGPRSPYGRHIFVGGNTWLLSLLSGERDILGTAAPDEALAATLAATRELLTTRTASLSIENTTRDDGSVAFDVVVTNLTGHKLPTGYPARRAWLRVRVLDAEGQVLWASGEYRGSGELVDASGAPLPSERAGGPLSPHRDTVTAEDEVQIYESMMAAPNGDTTFTLMRAASYVKDNRLLPAGFSIDDADPRTRPIGVADDPNFAAGGDRVRYEAAISGTPASLEATLLYVPLSARDLAELYQVEIPEVAALRTLLERAELAPVPLAQVSHSL